MQKIYFTIGDTITDSKENNVFKALCQPGILEGMQTSVASVNQIASTADIIINPGFAMTDSGSIIQESEAKRRTLDLSSASPAQFTIYYSYTPSGVFNGNPADIVIDHQLYAPNNLPVPGVLLSWVKYPGGGALLTSDMIIGGPRVKLIPSPEKFGFREGNQLQKVYHKFFPPFRTNWWTLATTGSALDVTDTFDPLLSYPTTTIRNNLGSQGTASYLIPLSYPLEEIGQVGIEMTATSGAVVSPGIMVDTTQYLITPTQLSSWLSMQENYYPVQIPNTVLSGKDCFYILNISLQAGAVVNIKSLGYSSFTSPI